MTCLAMTQCSGLVPRKPVCLLGVKLAGLLLLQWCIAAKGTAQHVCVLTRWQGCRWTRHGFFKMFSLRKNLEVLPWCVWKYNTQHGLYMHVRAWGSVRRGRVYVICAVAEQNQQCPFGTSTSWGWQAHRVGTVHLNCACPSGKRKCHAFKMNGYFSCKVQSATIQGKTSCHLITSRVWFRTGIILMNANGYFPVPAKVGKSRTRIMFLSFFCFDFQGNLPKKVIDF